MPNEEDVISDIRACLVSSGVGLSLFNLEKDYKNLIGKGIPFRELGYSSLLEFLESIGEFRVSSRSYGTYVEAITVAESKHIADLVKGQKKSKPKSRSSRFPSFRRPNLSFAKPHASRPLGYSPSYGNFGSSNSSSYKPLGKSSSSLPKPSIAQKMPQSYPMLVSKGNATPSISPRQLPSTTFSGSKPAEPNRPLPCSTFSGRKPAEPNRPLPSTTFVGSKPAEPHWPLPSTTFSGSKTAEPNDRLKSNPSSSQGKPPAYSEHPKLNHALPGANATSSLRQAPKPVQSKPEALLQLSKIEVKPPVLDNRVAQTLQQKACKPIQSEPVEVPARSPVVVFKPLDLVNRAAQVITAFSELEKKEFTEKSNTESIMMPPNIPFIRNSTSTNYSPYQQNSSTPSCSNFPPKRSPYSSMRSFIAPSSASVSPVQRRLDKIRQSSENQKVEVVRKPCGSNVKPKLVEPLVRPPCDKPWDLFVIKFVDLAKVTVRLIGPEYSDKYALMENRMKERYIKNFKTAPKVLPSELLVSSTYACIDVETNFVSRVLIQRYLKNTNEVSVVFFDLGEEAVVSTDKIYELENEFFSLPAQSFEVKLEGLEPYKFKEFIDDDFCVHSMCNKSYIAIVTDKENLSVNLYDTSSEVAFDVNQILQNKVACKIQSLYNENKTLKENECVEAFITNIDEMGNIFININNKAYKCLLERLIDIDRTKELKIQGVDSSNEINKLKYYFVFGESPQRAVLEKVISDDTVLMDFVDCGQYRIVQIKSLFRVPDFDKVLADIPHQATMVRLAGVDYSWASRHQSLFIEIVELFSKALVEVIYVRNDFPFVNISIFKNGQLINVGEVMNSMHFQLNESVLKKMQDIDGQFKYKQIDVPTEKYIGVLVPVCENAENISIQLVDYIQELRVLTVKIKLFYTENKPTRPFKEWRVGDACVVYSESNFFRGVILQLDSNKFAYVRSVDFGYVLLVPISNVFILNENFKDTPALAINAKLAGIEPICGNKNCEAAKLLNSYLKEQKKLCARVVSIDDSNPFSFTYSILLYDTTSEDDINFSELLVESGLALRAAYD